jgi:hypothetical protein
MLPLVKRIDQVIQSINAGMQVIEVRALIPRGQPASPGFGVELDRMRLA